MPWAPARPCAHPGCGELTHSGRCDAHRRQEMRAYNQRRGGSTKQGYGIRWQRAREAFLHFHPLCQYCYKAGKLIPATIVDHIRPHKGDNGLFWDESNWQALCKSCHDRKTAAADGRWGNKKYGNKSVA